MVEWTLPISSRCMTFPGCKRVRFGPTGLLLGGDDVCVRAMPNHLQVNHQFVDGSIVFD